MSMTLLMYYTLYMHIKLRQSLYYFVGSLPILELVMLSVSQQVQCTVHVPMLSIYKTLVHVHVHAVTVYVHVFYSCLYTCSSPQYEVKSGVRHESSLELERRLKMMALEKLKTEKLVAKLHSVSGHGCFCKTDGYNSASWTLSDNEVLVQFVVICFWLV